MMSGLSRWLLISIVLYLLLLQLSPFAYANAFIQADVLSLSTNAVASDTVNIGDLSLLAQDKHHLFPYYLRIEFPSTNFTAWGIQVYTNNNPNQSWSPINGLSGGLRGQSDPTHGIPLYWQVYDDLQDAAPTWGTPQSITTTAGGLAFNAGTMNYWGRLYDRFDIDVADETIWRSTNIVGRRTIANYDRLGQYPRSNRLTANPPIYLYLGLDMSAVTMSQVYGGTIIVDLYNLRVSSNDGGYATPNPFTPTTGQKTNFNFFVRDFNASFEINIYTIRGRKIKTLTDTREWDGRNEQGHIVEGGLYIFQIEVEGNRISGTVVLIK